MSRRPDYLPFGDARRVSRSLGLSSAKAYGQWSKSGARPANIPAAPDRIYRDEFQGWGDWLGTGNVANRQKEFLSFEEARAFVHTLGLGGQKEWVDYARSDQRPVNVPSHPHVHYGGEFKGYGDWLGTGAIATREVEFLNFYEARAYIHTLQLKSAKAWERYCQSGEKPLDIPSSPVHAYPDAFVDWYDWLGKKKRPKRKAFIYDALHIGVLRDIE